MAAHLRLLVTALLASLAMSASPQQPAQAPTFEAATIKPTARTDGSWRLQPTPDGYTGMDISLFKLVQEAYGIFDKKLILGGPAWIDSDKFDLEARFDSANVPDAAKLTYRQRADMLQSLLAERFHLKVHHESRPFPVFDLIVAKGGAKLKPSTPDTTHDFGMGLTCLHTRSGAEGCTVGNLADELRYPTGRTVIDKTGLTGRYDYTLTYSTPDTPASSPAAAYPSIFTAVQEEFGLKLEPSTAPLDVLVIDSAEKPTEN